MSLVAVDWAWAAGLFDGEGSIFTSRNSYRPKHVKLNLSLAMTDREPVDRFGQITGLKVRPVQRLTKSGKTVYRVSSQNEPKIREIWAALEKHLSDPKRKQGERALAARQYYVEVIKPENIKHRAVTTGHKIRGRKRLEDGTYSKEKV